MSFIKSNVCDFHAFVYIKMIFERVRNIHVVKPEGKKKEKKICIYIKKKCM